ncbi:MAG: hypothetical protein AAF125_05955 [Chloroflexota bacterium]
MTRLERISGELRWNKPLSDQAFANLRRIAPPSAFLTPNWLDLTRTRTTEKSAVFVALHDIALRVTNTTGEIKFAYTGLVFEFFTVRDGTLYREDAHVQWDAKQLPLADVTRHEAHTYDYDGLLKIPPLTHAQRANLKTLIRKHGSPYYERETNRLIVRHTTQDFNRWYANMLAQLAEITHNATGEIICQLHPNTPTDTPTTFERYQILERTLLVQQGHLQRHPPVKIPT